MAAKFMADIAVAENLLDIMTALIHPDLYRASQESIFKIKNNETPVARYHPNVQLWPSVFGAIQVIVNRQTPCHRDQGGFPTSYDLLLSIGTHTEARMTLREIGATFKYTPGSVMFLSGKVLLHECMSWSGGERICVTHFVKDSVHERCAIQRPSWPTEKDII
jgi:hypothetical protein